MHPSSSVTNLALPYRAAMARCDLYTATALRQMFCGQDFHTLVCVHKLACWWSRWLGTTAVFEVDLCFDSSTVFITKNLQQRPVFFLFLQTMDNQEVKHPCPTATVVPFIPTKRGMVIWHHGSLIHPSDKHKQNMPKYIKMSLYE